MTKSNRLLNLTSALLVASLLLSAAGCGFTRSYLEPEILPREQVRSAFVQTPSPIYREGRDLITIETIDGKPPTFLEDKAIIAPGYHTFQIRLELRHDSENKKEKSYVTRADTSVAFDVEAEHHYLIDAREDENGLWVWVTDKTTGYIVAGDPPRGLEPEKRIQPMWRKDIDEKTVN